MVSPAIASLWNAEGLAMDISGLSGQIALKK
jgi:hypothetical protein